MRREFDGLQGGQDAANQKLDALNAALQGLDLAALAGLNSKIDRLDAKLGPQVEGGLSGKLGRLAKWLQIDRMLGILNLWVNVHNAYMLSNNLAQTLFSTVDNVLGLFGNELKGDEGETIGVGDWIGTKLDNLFKGIFGVAKWEGIKAQWKAYNRVYQAASNLMWSLRSIGDSILNSLEIVGSHVAKIGNALRKYGEVSEKAYSWMNPSPNFENRFFTSIERVENVVSEIDSITSNARETTQTIQDIQQQRQELREAIEQLPGTTQKEPPGEAQAVAAEEDASKTDSQSPEIPNTSLTPPAT
jgi:hypothetical protein